MVGSVSEELARLARLREQGVLTDAEFEQQKAAVLRGEHAAAPEPVAPARKGRSKGCLIAVIAAVAVLIVLGFIGSKANTGGKALPPSAGSDATSAADKPALTMDGYNRVKTGMTFDQVTAIVGKPSQEMSRNEIAGTETVMYMWQGSFGANMNAMFQDGKLIQKAQFGLD